MHNVASGKVARMATLNLACPLFALTTPKRPSGKESVLNSACFHFIDIWRISCYYGRSIGIMRGTAKSTGRRPLLWMCLSLENQDTLGLRRSVLELKIMGSMAALPVDGGRPRALLYEPRDLFLSCLWERWSTEGRRFGPVCQAWTLQETSLCLYTVARN